jgi:putative ABC transport system permease protein
MKFNFLLRESLRALSGSPVRTLLTMLGVIIGVAAVIAMMSIGGGAQEATLREIQSLGVNNLYVQATRLTGEALEEARQSLSEGLSREDLKIILEKAPFLEAGSFEMSLDAEVQAGKNKPQANILGVGPNYFGLIPGNLRFGRLFVRNDFIYSLPLVILGEGLAREIYGNLDPTGQFLRIQSMSFQVIGVLSNRQKKGKELKSGSSLRVSDRDRQRDIYLPFTCLIDRFPLYLDDSLDSEKDPTYSEVSSIILKVGDPSKLALVRNFVQKILDDRHRGSADYRIIAPMDLLEKSNRVQEIFNLVMILIAGLSLVVGGIGIMNIMLANIQQRIKEIGVRRALGARQRDILVQFLLEAVVISFGGGLLGIGAGVLISQIIASTTGWTTVLSPVSILVSFTVSVGVGLVFGIFPARQASSLDPITALRYE